MTTPLLEFYQKERQKYVTKYGNETIVFIMVGKFYEVYGESAVVVADLCNIILTRKNKNLVVGPKNPYLCGFPTSNVVRYIQKMQRNNYTIAVIDQTSETSEGMERQCSGIYSPSSPVESILSTFHENGSFHDFSECEGPLTTNPNDSVEDSEESEEGEDGWWGTTGEGRGTSVTPGNMSSHLWMGVLIRKESKESKESKGKMGGLLLTGEWVTVQTESGLVEGGSWCSKTPHQFHQQMTSTLHRHPPREIVLFHNDHEGTDEDRRQIRDVVDLVKMGFPNGKELKWVETSFSDGGGGRTKSRTIYEQSAVLKKIYGDIKEDIKEKDSPNTLIIQHNPNNPNNTNNTNHPNNPYEMFEKLGLERQPEWAHFFSHVISYLYDQHPLLVFRLQPPHLDGTEEDVERRVMYNPPFVDELNLLEGSPSLCTMLDCTKTVWGRWKWRQRFLSPLYDETELQRRWATLSLFTDEAHREDMSRLHTVLVSSLRQFPQNPWRMGRRWQYRRWTTSLYSSFYRAMQQYQNAIRHLSLLPESLKSILGKASGEEVMETVEKLLDEMKSFMNEEYEKGPHRCFWKELEQEYNDVQREWERRIGECMQPFVVKYSVPLKFPCATSTSPFLSIPVSSLVSLYHSSSSTKDDFYFTLSGSMKASKQKEIRDRVLKIEGWSMVKNQLYYEPATTIFRECNKRMDAFYHKERMYREKVMESIYMRFHCHFAPIFEWAGDLDVLMSQVSFLYQSKFRYSRPTIVTGPCQSPVWKARHLRHPILEVIHPHTMFVGNDVDFGPEGEGGEKEAKKEGHRGILMYGHNSAGKSTLLKSIGIATWLAQIGMMVPADDLEFTPMKRLFGKLGTGDNLYKGLSTFMVEMMELRHFMNFCEPRVMILCDELTSGTEIHSATGILASTISFFLRKRCFFFLTTHLHSLKMFPDLMTHPAMGVFHIPVGERKCHKGMGPIAYGIEMTEHLGMEEEWLRDSFHRRKAFLDRIENVYHHSYSFPHCDDGNDDHRDDDGNDGHQKRGIPSWTPPTLLPPQRSRYDKRLVMDKCQSCGSKDSLHTHHVIPQCEADERGFVGHFHKDSLFNLQVLCEGCHSRHHSHHSH